ncbi:serine hydrolase domain-containing protein [Kribbella deserti]|uniref:Serine hydrolase domain-containing protein n=1 Tax=Kribbella deserti TaxID=1926257 RepID=A0ABV6QJG1_9ACTN
MTDIAAQTQSSLVKIIAARQVKGRVPGIVGGVAREGVLAWSAGVGSADVGSPGVAPTADSQFLIASQSKTLTAVLIMALRDEGKLSLDDLLEKHIPESKHHGITIRQMLSHVTGMQREPVDEVWSVFEFPDRAQLITGWNDAERVGRPHDRWHYSNLVYSLLGELVARLDGRDWMDSIRARILEPLEMRRTSLGFDGGPAATGYYVPPYSDVPVLEPVFDLGAMAACGGLASTAEDLAKWTSFVANPVDEVLAPDTLEEMCQPQIMADVDQWTLGFGLGFMLLRQGERVLVGHTGGMPGHITGSFVHRPSGTAGIALMNSTSAPDPAGLAAALALEVLDNDPLPDAPWMPGTSVPAEFTGLLGTWFSEGQPYVFFVVDGRLHARGAAAPAHKPPSVFTPVGEDLYRTEAGRERGELLRIARDPSGAVKTLHWATYLFTREPYAFGEWLK